MVAITVTQHWADLKRLHVIGTVALTGNYVTGGDIISFADPLIKTASPPQLIRFLNLSKYLLRFAVGTTLANGKIKIIVPDTGLELAQAAYPAALTGDTITFEGIFRKFR